jgi:hypothetical protein
VRIRVRRMRKIQKIDLLDVAEDSSAAFIRYGTHALKLSILLATSDSELGKPIRLGNPHAQRAIQIIERFRSYAVRIFGALESSTLCETGWVSRGAFLLGQKHRSATVSLRRALSGLSADRVP